MMMNEMPGEELWARGRLKQIRGVYSGKPEFLFEGSSGSSSLQESFTQFAVSAREKSRQAFTAGGFKTDAQTGHRAKNGA